MCLTEALFIGVIGKAFQMPLTLILSQADKIAASHSCCATGSVCSSPWQLFPSKFILRALCSEMFLQAHADMQ
jgi:hypothetical protein